MTLYNILYINNPLNTLKFKHLRILKCYKVISIIINDMERYDIQYNDTETLIINELRKQAISQYKIIEVVKNSNINNFELTDKYKNNSKIYVNQERTAYKIINIFVDKKVLCVMVVQPTQSGKTGIMFTVCKLFIENPLYMVNPKNIFIISGLSSIDWKKQTIERFPDIITSNIYHRNNLDEFLYKIQDDPRNALILMDEIQIANTKNKCINQIFEKANLYDFNFLYQNNIKIIQFSATPDGCYYDIKRWNDDNYKVILGEVDRKYTSAIDIYNDKRIFQSKPLSLDYNLKIGTQRNIKNIIKNVEEIKFHLDTKFNNPSYIIIRIPTNKEEYENSLQNIKYIFNEKEFNYIEYNQKLKIDINRLCLNNKPDKTTFIIIKEKLRVAYTINQKYISILYDRFVKNPNDSAIIQSLLGRATGYAHNMDIIIFTNIDSIIKYDKLIKSNFKDNTINWKSISTKK